MAVPVEMPKLGNTVEECIVAKWLKAQGETVSAEDVVVEIETDKASFEVVTPISGTLLATFFDEGVLVPVYTALFVVGEPGEDAEAFRPASGASTSSSAGATSRPVFQQPSAKPAVAASRVPEPSGASAGISPRARRFAEEHRVNPGGVCGSGPGGRVLESNLRELHHAPPSFSTRRSQTAGAVIEARVEDPAPTRAIAAFTPEALGDPISGVREKIARRMRESLSSTAQYTLHSSADARGLIALRSKAKATSVDVNINDLVMFCTVRALMEMPELNLLFVGRTLLRSSEIHIGFACDTPRGLLVPVVHHTQNMSAAELAARIRELSAQAVQGKIAPDDLTGGTFTVSNLGGLGVESFTPLLNLPQVAILGVNAIHLRPVRGAGGVEFIDTIGLSLTLDHQIVDGAPGARFLRALCNKIANVEQLCTI